MKLDMEAMVVDGQLDLEHLERVIPTFVPDEGRFVFRFSLDKWVVVITANSYLSGYEMGWRPEDITRRIRIRISLWCHAYSLYDYVSQDDDDKLRRVKGVCFECTDIKAHNEHARGTVGY
jgi:hypothetical protein